MDHPRPDGSIAGDSVRLVDFNTAAVNVWLMVNQFAISDGFHSKRFDLVVLLNGLPLGLIELKNAAADGTKIWSVYAQLQTYKAEISTLLSADAVLMVR